MSHNPWTVCLLLLCLTFGWASAAHGTILTFDQNNPDGSGVSNFEGIDQTYGDNVTGSPDANNNGYAFGDEGTTPNVTVEYTGFGTNPGSADPSLWTTGYGNLTNILFEDNDNFGLLNVVFTAEPGWEVQLFEFDMAAFSNAFTSDPTINFVRVLDGDGNELFFEEDAVISESTRTSFDFTSEPLTASTIQLQFDTGNLGGLSDDIAFDNVRFGQVIPEPATAALLLVVAAGLPRRRRR